ncbi:hypothetical protein AMTRI_Chr03g146820 [Amborella trichopoda]|uniref:60S ribosomal protein L18a-like protein n=1 Tax=Amborella trichopoda TaxID=13333 RepID=UPI0005D3E2AF|nr:60S ribosomal protein L18a-like protein [Amborella trichopoda]XP_011621555.1 60S ribosomal protein L18a-like protein [Amborella trichopoda]|eukprot:XP_011621554.1 60S ribosomal protein L18a-like protein [Amborella trichopoda]
MSVLSMEQGRALANEEVVQRRSDEGKYSLLRPDTDKEKVGLYDKPLSCFGCGVGWFSFLLGFTFPPLWYFATILYFGSYYLKDPRERAGLAASAIAALICSVAVLIVALVVFL